VDSQLDRVQLEPRPTHDEIFTSQASAVVTSPRTVELQSIIKSLSTTSSSSPLLSSWRISSFLENATLAERPNEVQDEEVTHVQSYEEELEWILVSKATVQTYGLLLSTLVEQTIPLSDDIWYWDELLGSYTYIGLYTIQTSPLRLWSWTKDIYSDARTRLAQLRESPGDAISAQKIGTGLTDQWKQFYGLVRESIRERSIADIQRHVLSPIALCRAQAKHNRSRLKRLQEMNASGLGLLMDEGLNFDINDESIETTQMGVDDSHDWKGVVARSVALMDTVLHKVTAFETSVSDFEDAVFAAIEDDPEISTSALANNSPAKLSKRLQQLLQVHLPHHIAASRSLTSEYGRPSRLVRYWLPAGVLLLSSSTILRILFNKQAEIIIWCRDLGTTVRDFWFNWVVEPTKKIIGTIRHDKDSEVAIMSRESLKGDRDSLERMVVDFAIDNATGRDPLTETQISDIRAKVKEGDLTPVLRAYERDLRKPLVGTVRGDLVRTLLIQVQKTKVDVEVAISGIDSLLKSQELVFGFVGLTPSILICYAAFRYLGGTFDSRSGLKRDKRANQALHVLRNIDRILTLAVPTENSLLSYKDHGLLLCEVHVLRERVRRLFPGNVKREFLEDVGDLCNVASGIQTQLRVLERIRWGYSKWLR
jgi:nuclear-control-of-ATPase protein 2